MPIRWSIRDQILIPLIAIQGVAVTAIAATTATLAARRSERQVVDRVNGVVDVVGHSNFPYTGAVLGWMERLSGARFVAFGADRQVEAASFAADDHLVRSLAAIPPAAHLDSLGDAPSVSLSGTRHFAVRLNVPRGTGASSLVVLYPETSWRHARREAALPPLLLGLSSLCLLVGVTSWLVHRLSKRLERMQRQVARIAAGDFQELHPGRFRDEVHDLSLSINQMYCQLREMRKTIQQSERTRLLAQLAAGLAHQLRNSLTGARMSVQLHARRYPAPEGDQTLSIALRQLSLTEEQVKGLLSLGRVERLLPTVFDAQALIDDVVLLVQHSCQHSGVGLRRAPCGDPLMIVGDRLSVRAAVLNLVLNAAEAAGTGGWVAIDVAPLDGAAAIDVRDSGPGPPPNLAERLFEAFTTSKPEGVGLGLALAHQVALENGGSLSWSRSNDETCFRLVVPQAGGTFKEAV
jgi:signal transduction histidine kinase